MGCLRGWPRALPTTRTLPRKLGRRSGLLSELVTVSILLPSFTGILGDTGRTGILGELDIGVGAGQRGHCTIAAHVSAFRRASTSGGQRRRSRGAEIRQWQRRQMVELKADERGRNVV